jgi:Cu/Ag efflux pump CusA
LVAGSQPTLSAALTPSSLNRFRGQIPLRQFSATPSKFPTFLPDADRRVQVVGVVLAGGTFSVASMIGFITLFGIATRNGIMLISHIKHLLEVEGITDFREAVRRGAEERLIPILMTAMAAGLALIPLALGGGKTGSEIQTPMAIVILCGLTTSTLLNMVVVPTLYLRYARPAAMSPLA